MKIEKAMEIIAKVVAKRYEPEIQEAWFVIVDILNKNKLFKKAGEKCPQ